ncbi:hypothetical protein ACHAXM_002314 [Skeletonema potamos]|jgi:hypothetical protein
MSFTTKIADFLHKSVVTTFFGLFCYQGYQLGSKMIQGRTGDGPETNNTQQQQHPQEGFIQMLRDKYQEEYTKYFDTGHRDWYDKDDNSFLDKVPKPKDYQPGGKRN